jgi:FkbM family methyltransferase
MLIGESDSMRSPSSSTFTPSSVYDSAGLYSPRRAELFSRLRLLLGEAPLLPTLAARCRMFVFPRRSRNLISRLGNPVKVALFGLQIDLDLRIPHDAAMFLALTREGLYEPETSRFLLDRLQPSTTFIDVGANNGYYSILAALKILPGMGQICSIEPNPKPFSRLLRNISINRLEHLVYAFCLAAGAAEGRSLLSGAEFDDAWGSLTIASGDSTPVYSIRLDTLVPLANDLVIKIDVEGSELNVIRGLGWMAEGRKRATLIVEWNRNYATSELWRALVRRWEVHRIDPSPLGFKLTPILEFHNLKRRALCNLACLPR